MRRVTHFKKSLAVERSKPYGTIRIYFGSEDEFHDFPPLTLSRFLAISSILENKTVKYDIEKKKLVTDIEQSGPQTPQA